MTEAQEFLKITSQGTRHITLTRVAYQPTGDDIIIHNCGTRARYENKVDFITSSEWIKDTRKPASYQALLGTQDSIEEINNVFQWLNGTNAYGWRVNPKSYTVDERVAGFHADSNRAYLYCDWTSTSSGFSLGVCLRKKILGAIA